MAYKGEDAVKGAASKVRGQGGRQRGGIAGRERRARKAPSLALALSTVRAEILFPVSSSSFAHLRRVPCPFPRPKNTQAKSAMASVTSDDVSDKIAAFGEDLKAAWAKTDDKPAVLILAAAAVVALIAASAVTNAVDHVPIISDLLRLEGLVVSGWFTYRYLAFKPDREELLRNVDAYLAKVLGK